VLHHPSLSATLAEQRREGLHQQAELARLARGTGNARRSSHATYRWWRPATRTARTHDSSNRQRDSVLPVGDGHRQPIGSDHQGVGGPGAWPSFPKSSRWEDSTRGERGAPARRYYKLTSDGFELARAALARAYTTARPAWLRPLGDEP
jgi:hypothetical protein